MIDKDKQETLEEVAGKILAKNGVYDEDMILSDTFSKVVNSMVDMVKWKNEKGYIYEEVIAFANREEAEMYAKGFRAGSEFQQEQNLNMAQGYLSANLKNIELLKRSYSEEEVLKFTQTILMQYKFGNTDIEQMDLLKETFQLFKTKQDMKQESLEEKLDKIVSKEPSKFLEESDKRMEAKAKLFRYSEEEVLDILYKHTEDMLAGNKVTLEEWFDKVKKK